MPRNPTAERLAGLPFTSATELKASRREILLAAWNRLETAKAVHELSQREEYQFWQEEFAQGLVCRYGGEGEELVRVYSDGPGIKITVNQELADTLPYNGTILVGVLVKAMSESLYKARGILPPESGRDEEHGKEHREG